MKIYSVRDREFEPYGKIIEGYDVEQMMRMLKGFKIGEGYQVDYIPFDETLENTEFARVISDRIFGGLPAQVGCCWGKNTKLNCLEYHRSSELNLSSDDFILLLAKEDEIVDGKIDTSKVKAFRCEAGTLINVFATTLHYAPCSSKNGKGFKVMVALPIGTNTEYSIENPKTVEDRMLFARNKWLIAHSESDEAKKGAYIGLEGENIDIKKFI